MAFHLIIMLKKKEPDVHTNSFFFPDYAFGGDFSTFEETANGIASVVNTNGSWKADVITLKYTKDMTN